MVVNDLGQELPNTFRKVKDDGSAATTDKLFRNDWNNRFQRPVFTDVSKQAGISWEGYGLGINIIDINKDGWKDIYVSNDYLTGDLLYINNRNGTFTNASKQYFKHTSLNGMGNDAADINNDGLVDLVETDMAAEDNYRYKMMMNSVDYNWYVYTKYYDYPFQTVRNTLQLNRGPQLKEGDSIGAPVFSEIGLYSGIAYTDWSWSALFMDADQDGYKDLMVTNGLPKDVTDLDFITYRDQQPGTAVTDLMLKLPEAKMSNYIFHNNGDITFADKTKDWGWDFPTFSSGMAYADLDGDGDMDIVINNTNMPATILRNNISDDKKTPHNYLRIKFRGDTSNINGIGTVADIYYSGRHQTAELTPYRGYMSSMENVLHFGLGAATAIDSLVIAWPNGTRDVKKNLKVNQTMLISRSSKAVPFSYTTAGITRDTWVSNITAAAGVHYINQGDDFADFNIQRMLPHKFSASGPSLAAADITGDGLQDIIVGGNGQQPTSVLVQQPDHRFKTKPLTAPAPQGYDEGICIFDADGDGDMDLYITSGGYAYQMGAKAYQDRFYVNDGKGNFSIDTLAVPVNDASKSCVKAADFDMDGRIDLFIGGQVVPGNYPLAENGYLLHNNSANGKIRFEDVSSKAAQGLSQLGIINDALWTDIDNDNDPDLMVTGEWMGVVVFKNEQGQLKRQSTSLDKETGWWNSLVAADIDNDGDMDYIAGNFGLNGYFKTAANEPVNMYAKDFDNNNHLDFLISQWKATAPHGTKAEYPVPYRDEVAAEMPSVKKHFNTYGLYAKAEMKDVLKVFNASDAQKFTVAGFATIWIENKGNFNFEIHALPAEAQLSTVYGIVAGDFNADGNIDIALNGNEYSMAPVPFRNDAFYGLLLAGDGTGNFKSLPALQSGLYIPGNGKALLQLPVGNTLALVASQNEGPLLVFGNRQPVQAVPLQPGEVSALMQLQDGKKRKEEFYYGSGFLSQPSRFVYMNKSVNGVTIFSDKKTSRIVTGH